MTLGAQYVHTMAKGLLFEESGPILLVPDLLLHNVLLNALGLLDILAVGFQD